MILQAIAFNSIRNGNLSAFGALRSPATNPFNRLDLRIYANKGGQPRHELISRRQYRVLFDGVAPRSDTAIVASAPTTIARIFSACAEYAGFRLF